MEGQAIKKILHLTLKRRFFDMIASGEKEEEYREIKPYWVKRLISKQGLKDEGYKETDLVPIFLDFIKDFPDCVKQVAMYFDTVSANNGYAKDCPNIKWQHKGIRIGEGKPEWGAVPGVKYFILEIGELIKQ